MARTSGGETAPLNLTLDSAVIRALSGVTFVIYLRSGVDIVVGIDRFPGQYARTGSARNKGLVGGGPVGVRGRIP